MHPILSTPFYTWADEIYEHHVTHVIIQLYSIGCSRCQRIRTRKFTFYRNYGMGLYGEY